MHTTFKRLKYKFIAPSLITLKNGVLGNRTQSTQAFPNAPSSFFIMGSGRNGSTLLALLLNRHPEIFLPPEQYALPFSIFKWHLRYKQVWEAFCIDVLKDYQKNNQDWQLNPQDFKQVENDLIKWKKIHQNPANIYTKLLQHYGQQLKTSFSLVGDHSPVTTLHYKTIAKEFPTSKYLFLIRHPLDVISSYSKLENNPASNPTYAAWKWNNSVEAYHWMQEQGKEVLLVRYEDLVSNVSDTMCQIFNFLGTTYIDVEQATEQELNTDLLGAGDYKHHQNLYKSIDSTFANKWKQQLTADKVAAYWPMVKQKALQMTYDIER